MVRDIATRLAERASMIDARISAAATRSGRNRRDVVFVAVTKYVDAEVTRLVVDAGCSEIGESRPQSLWDKGEALKDRPVRWHLIGHLQRNKVDRTIRYKALIHSVDSLRLLTAISESAVKQKISAVPLLLEVNISGDASKYGFHVDEMENALIAASQCHGVAIHGLMGMAALKGDDETARRNFAGLRGLRDSLRANCPPNVNLTELSMGMSRDYEMAIEEGSTIVRIGSTLFDGIVDLAP